MLLFSLGFIIGCLFRPSIEFVCNFIGYRKIKLSIWQSAKSAFKDTVRYL